MTPSAYRRKMPTGAASKTDPPLLLAGPERAHGLVAAQGQGVERPGQSPGFRELQGLGVQQRAAFRGLCRPAAKASSSRRRRRESRAVTSRMAARTRRKAPPAWSSSVFRSRRRPPRRASASASRSSRYSRPR
jgi:hypothetical protein